MGRLWRRAVLIEEYDSDIKYRNVKENHNPDALSRLSCAMKSSLLELDFEHSTRKTVANVTGRCIEVPINSEGNRYLLVIEDSFSKWLEAYPMKGQQGIIQDFIQNTPSELCFQFSYA